MSTAAFQQFKPPGPVTAAFLNDRDSRVRCLRGPVAGGKTVTCIFDCLQNAGRMPICKDGWLHYRVAVIGATYGQLEKNLYPTWFEWLPRDGGDWTEGETVGGGGRYMRQVLKFWVRRDNQSVPVRFEVIFSAIGEAQVEQFCRGFEPTAWYLYELDLLPEGIVENAIGRLSRYPNAKMLGRPPDYRSYVIADLNAPDVDSWYYRLVEEYQPAGLKQYVQPSGVSPRAENLHNLMAGHYDGIVEANSYRPRWIRRFVHNEYGPSDEGEPVYPEWSDELHYAREPIPANPNRPLLLGLDQGLTRPAGVVAQRAPSGQLRVLAECVPGRMNARRFAEQLKRTIAEIAPHCEIAGAWADPAGWYGADREAGETAWSETVQLELGVPIWPAPTNEISVRLQAVKDELNFQIDGQTPGLFVSPRCGMLRKGFASHYRYARQRVGNTDRYSDKPEKNDWSNPHDALQYLILGELGRYQVVAGKARGKTRMARPSVRVKSDFGKMF